jgi:transcriptional regulator with XRE-family HTH domain
MNKSDPTPYQANLAAWRTHRDLTQEQVAETLDVSHTTVGRWEKGELPISSRRLVDLCRLYSVTPSQLLMTPEAAEAADRARQIQEMVEGLDAESFDHLRFVASRIKGAG